MPLMTPVQANRDEEDYEKPPEGQQAAICCWVVDQGNHLNERSGSWQRKCRLTFELPRCLMKDNRPFVISAMYTMSFYGSSYAKVHFTTWFGKTITDETQMDWFKLAGRHATVQVKYSDDGKWANVIGITPPAEADKELTLHNNVITWTFGGGGLPEELPDFIKAKAMQSREWNEQGQFNDVPPGNTGDREAPPF